MKNIKERKTTRGSQILKDIKKKIIVRDFLIVSPRRKQNKENVYFSLLICAGARSLASERMTVSVISSSSASSPAFLNSTFSFLFPS
jgi:hypothetical protein